MLKFVFVVGQKHPWGINPTSPPVFIHTCQGAEIFEINGIYSRDGLIQVRGKLPNSSMLICVVCCVFCILDMHLFFLFRLGICLKNLWFTIKSKNSALQTFNEDTCFFFSVLLLAFQMDSSMWQKARWQYGSFFPISMLSGYYQSLLCTMVSCIDICVHWNSIWGQKYYKQSGSCLLHLSTNRIHPVRNVQLGKSYLRALTLQLKARQMWSLWGVSTNMF